MEEICAGWERNGNMLSILSSSNTLWVLLSTMTLGVAAGTIGCIAYWKRQNLMSDALSHAALPGVVIAFLLWGEKNLLVLVIGAGITALIGALFIQWVTTSSRITEDSAMGMVLAVFYGFGIMLLAIANRLPGGNQSGLDNFIYGQAAAMVRSDVITMLILALVVLFIVFISFKEWKIFLFDKEFAQGLGISIQRMNTLYSVVLVMAIVIGIQAVGVILMAALLIIPAVSARYWTQSFHWMILLSALIGGLSGVLGTLVSTMKNGLPTGPFIVVVGAGFFVLSFLFGKEKGLFVNYVQYKFQQKQQLKLMEQEGGNV